MKLGLKNFLLFIFVTSLCLSNAQKRHSLHYTVRDGLPSNKIYCATQDAAGFMWLGTDNGLVRFNGSEFKIFTVKDGLPDNDIFAVFEDQQARLWILGFKQAPCYFYRNKLYTTANDTFLAKYFQDPDMYRYTVNRAQKKVLFFINYNNRFCMLEYGKIRVLPVDYSKEYIKGQVFSLYTVDKTDYLIIPREFINLNTNTWKTYNNTEFIINSDQVTYRNKALGLSNNLVSSKVMLFTIDKDSVKQFKILPYPGMIGPYTNGGSEAMFLNQNGEIFSFDTTKLDFIREPYSIPEGRITTGYIDRSGNKWVGTHDNGFYIFPKYSSEILETGSDKGATCMVLNPDHTVSVGFENKTIYTYGKGSFFSRYEMKDKRINQIRITGMVSDKGYIYVGGDFALGKYDIRNATYASYPKTLSNLLFTMKDIELSKKGRLLIGSANGAGIFSQEEGKFIDEIWKTRTTAICDAVNGDMYLGTIDGLHIRRAGSDLITKYLTNTPIDRARITDIKIDRLGRVWVGTAQFGLFILEAGKILSLTDDKKSACFLTSYYIKNIFLDNRDIAWVSTDKGLNRVSLPGKGNCAVERITTAFGIPDNNISASCVLGDTIYISSLSGVCRFIYSPSIFREIPVLEITGTFINYDKREINDGLLLPFKENNISIEFSVIAYRSAGSIVCEYRLSGSDEQWISTMGNRVDLLSLNPGTYRFEVRATNTTTGETSPIRQVSFVIAKPWYLSWWFISLLLIIITAIVWLIVGSIIKRIRQTSELRNHMNKQVAELEMQALRAQMNPHFIFNALTAIQNYFVNNNEEKANAFMSKFAMLIRQMLDYSKDNFIPLDEEISLLTNYMTLEKMRFEDKLDFVLHIDENMDPSEFKLPSLLIQPLLENAVNHGIRHSKNKGTISLSISRDSGFLTCEIRDNGIGISRSMENKVPGVGHQSKGMDILEKRINFINQLYNSSVSMVVIDLSGPQTADTGTLIIFKFPLELVSRPLVN